MIEHDDENPTTAVYKPADFIKSSWSGKWGGMVDCVEVANNGASVGVRDSKNPSSAVLSFSRSEWAAFVKGVKDGEFDPR